MRVITGTARGTKLRTLESLETRPTSDRVKEAIFNMNTLKLLVANLIILGVSLLLVNPLYSLWSLMNLSETVSAILEMVSIVAIDAIIYLVFLGLTKENLVSSFLRKKNKVEENA